MRRARSSRASCLCSKCRCEVAQVASSCALACTALAWISNATSTDHKKRLPVRSSPGRLPLRFSFPDCSCFSILQGSITRRQSPGADRMDSFTFPASSAIYAAAPSFAFASFTVHARTHALLLLTSGLAPLELRLRLCGRYATPGRASSGKRCANSASTFILITPFPRSA